MLITSHQVKKENLNQLWLVSVTEDAIKRKIRTGKARKLYGFRENLHPCHK